MEVRDQEWAGQHQTNTGRGGGIHGFDARGNEARSYARDRQIAGGILEWPLIRCRDIGRMTKTVVASKVGGRLRRRMCLEVEGRSYVPFELQTRLDEICDGNYSASSTAYTKEAFLRSCSVIQPRRAGLQSRTCASFG